ncbi:MAG: hypothetical protein ACREIU_09755 [Planctomycetota bacterium]
MSGRQGTFESCRSQRAPRGARRGREGRPAPAKAELLKLLESAEKQDLLDRQLKREMEEFFEDSARLAAQALRKLTDAERKRIEQKVVGELREFLHEARRRSADLATRLKAHEDRRRGNGGGEERAKGSEGRSGSGAGTTPGTTKEGRSGLA